MNIAITGATGYIGKYLCRELVNSNHLNILTRNIINAKAQLPYENINLLNLSLPRVKLKKELKNTEVLIHLAGNRPKKLQSDKSLNSYLNSIILTDKILDLLPKEKCIRIVNISTKSVYGPNNIPPYDETQIPKPSNFYGLSKMIGEQLIDIHGIKSKSSIIHLRVGQVIGWGDSQNNNFATFLDNALNNRTQQIWGDGRGSRCYIYAKDVVNAIKIAIKRKETGSFNIVWLHAINHLDLAKTINLIFGNDKLEFITDKSSDTNEEKIDISKAREILKWTPQYSTIEDALKDMKKDYEENSIYWI